MFTVGSLFTGIGGIDLAFQEAGFQIAYQVEIEDYCQKVLAKHWSDVTRYQDIYQVDLSTVPYVDVITAGFPCQPFSVAGKQKGREDERFLVPVMLHWIKEKKPYVVLFENVPGFANLNDGTEFKELLRQIAEMGYDAQWGHLRASDVGAPHRRERLFIVVYRSQERCGFGGDHRERRHLLHDQNGNAAQDQSQRERRERRTWANCQTMGNTQCRNLEAKRQSERPISYSSPKARQTNSTRYASRGQVESRLGRDFARIPSWLDRHQFPTPPGEQYEWEPPRTTERTEHRTARIKALGNAVVPQVIYPIALAIREWLENEG